MNRHRAYWSAMGPGFATEEKARPMTKQEYYELIRGTFSGAYQFEYLSNLLAAVRQIKKELDI